MEQLLEKSCRICLKIGTIYLFNEAKNYAFQFSEVSSIQIYPGDGLPKYLCKFCIENLNSAYKFRSKIQTIDEQLRQKITKKLKNVNCPKFPTNVIETISISLDDSDNDNSIDFDNFHTNHETKTVSLDVKEISINEMDNFDKIMKNPTKNTIKKLSSQKTNKMFICELCGKVSISRGNLENHMRIHSGEKPYKCKECDAGFSQSGHLLTHNRTHTGVKPYKCDKCSKSFIVNTSLKNHLKTHTGERAFGCSFCDKKFVTSYHLAIHQRRHTGERNFKCNWPECTLSFVDASEMKRHYARHRNGNTLRKSRASKINGPKSEM